MGREQSGRGGLSPRIVAAAVRLLRDGCTPAQISARLGISQQSARRLRRGVHRSQCPIDRRGLEARKLRRIAELLDLMRPVNLSKIARQVGVHRDTVVLVFRGRHISQRQPHVVVDNPAIKLPGDDPPFAKRLPGK